MFEAGSKPELYIHCPFAVLSALASEAEPLLLTG